MTGKLKKFGIPLAVVLVLSFPLYLGGYYTEVLTLVFINVLLIQSLNVLTGYAGQISLGQAGLYAVGAYGSATLMLEYSFPFFVAVPAAILITVAIGFLLSLPARRVTEFYLAMLTLGFGIIVEVVVREWSLLGGFSGLSLIPSPITSSLTIFGLTVGSAAYYYIALIAMLVAALLTRNLVRSHIGRSFLGVRENEIAASSMGINPGSAKQLAYMISAALAGLSGALYAHYIAYLGYEQFSLLRSVEILTMALIGGLGSFLGPFIGGVFETWVPQLLQSFEDYQLLIYGVILVAVIRLRPSGLAGLLRVRDSYINISEREMRELGEGSTPGDADELEESRHASEEENVVVLNDITKTFDSLKALDDVSLTLRRGEIHGLVGPNGSGKSTLINVLTGAYPANAGGVFYEEEPISGLRMDQIARKGVIRIFQDPRLILDATVLENVLLGAQRHIKAGFWSALSGYANRREEGYWTGRAFQSLRLCGISDHAQEVVGSLPYGTRRLAEVARAIISEPNVLVLDEPAAGLSEDEILSLGKLMRRLRSRGTTIVVIEHDMEFIADVVDRVTVLDGGKLIYQGDVASMQSDKNVVEAYLGTA